MKPPIIRLFCWSAGLLFLVTAVSKFVSAGGSARVLQVPDPLLGLPFGTVFWIVGGIETTVALFCFFGKRPALQTGLVAWLASNFVIYRIGLKWVGYHKPCSCLGNLTDALHISPETADTTMKVVLGYLLIGSYASLFWLWRSRSKLVDSAVTTEATIAALK
ncbi:MAG: MauE/DoxX family redox-associated membrane protein [Verrucomicrobiota bacterium]